MMCKICPIGQLCVMYPFSWAREQTEKQVENFEIQIGDVLIESG